MEYHEGQGYLISGDIKSRKERRNKMTMEYFGKDETTIKELLDYVEKLKKKSDDEKGDKEKCGMEKVERMGMDDSKVATRLLEKNWSPLLVRKYQLRGWPLFLGIITDCSISSLDTLFYKVVDEAEKLGMFDQDLQNIRNFVGFLSDKVIEHFDSMKRGSVEGVAIMWYVDKCAVASSLFGDHMVHKACRDEFYFIIGMLPHI